MAVLLRPASKMDSLLVEQLNQTAEGICYVFVLLQLIAVKIIGKRCEAEAESESENLDLLTETQMNELSLTSSLVKAFGLS